MQVIKEQTFNLISTNDIGALSNGICSNPLFSSNGRYIAFFSEAVDYQTGIATAEFQLVVKDLITQNLIYPNNGNGVCYSIHPTYENTRLRIAAFSPDSSKIAFYSNSTDLILDDNTVVQTIPSTDYRWYIYDIENETISRVAFNGTEYGNLSDSNELLWKNNSEVVFVSYSSNIVAEVNNNYHREVYLKNILTNNIQLVSRKENSNISPFLTYNNFNIDVNDNTNQVSFFSQELGFCIKNLNTSTLTRVQDLPTISSYGIVLANFFSFNLDGSKSLFKIEQGAVTFPYDTNSKTDEFIYDFNTSSVALLNDNGGITGDGTSTKASFSPNGLKVSFICNSSDIDITSTNDVKNLYVKEISTNILTRVSIPVGGGNLSNDVLDYTWITNDKICFSSYSNDLVVGDINNTLDIFIRNISNSTTRRINVNVSGVYQFTIPIGHLHSTMFYNNRICLSALIEDISGIDNTIGYDRNNIFIKWFEDENISLPTNEIYAYANDAINSTINNNHINSYTSLDTITGTPTLSVIGSSYVERVNSIQYKNDFTDVRWLSINCPVTYNDTPSIKIGMGIYQATPTLLDDFLDLKQNPLSPSNLNSVYGIAANINVDSQLDIVILSAGEDQMAVCASTVYLEAAIRGNTAGHTFLWELIEGSSTPPITLVQTSETQAYYLTSTSTDLKFRYWIDKGRLTEQYKDVIIYSTPTSIVTENTLTSNINHKTENQNLYVDSINTSSNFDYNIEWNSLAEYATTLSIQWGLPTIFYNTPTPIEILYKDYFKSTVLEKHIGQSWEEIVVKDKNDIRTYYSVADGDVIRIGAKYKKPGHEEFEVYYRRHEYITPALLANNVLSNFNGSSNNLTHNITTVSYDTLAGLEDTVHILKTTSNVNSYNTRRVTYDTLDGNTEDIVFQLTHTSNNISFNLTRVNGGNIGG